MHQLTDNRPVFCYVRLNLFVFGFFNLQWSEFISTTFYQRSHLEFRRIENGLLYRTLISNLNQGAMVFFRKIRRHDNFKNNLFDESFSIFCLTMFKTLYKGNIFSGDISFLAKTEDKKAGTCADRSKKVVIRRRGGVLPAIFHRLVCCNDESVKLSINLFPTRKCNLDFYCFLLFVNNYNAVKVNSYLHK